MTKSIAEEIGAAHAPGSEGPKLRKKARVAAKRGHVGAKSAKKAHPGKKTSTGAKTAGPARDGNKAAKVLDLLKRPNGVTLKDLTKATGWQAHSVRGFLSGAVRKKMGLTVTSTKGEDGERTYSVKV